MRTKQQKIPDYLSIPTNILEWEMHKKQRDEVSEKLALIEECGLWFLINQELNELELHGVETTRVRLSTSDSLSVYSIRLEPENQNLSWALLDLSRQKERKGSSEEERMIGLAAEKRRLAIRDLCRKISSSLERIDTLTNEGLFGYLRVMGGELVLKSDLSARSLMEAFGRSTLSILVEKAELEKAAGTQTKGKTRGRI